ncbi:unnamed protein product [Owenia fusiformis]|uniref:Uncharacterized protein n=1 Tax=Owenia fusiformis TaxID=6347 RepID=A0A8J1UVI2_OWEFU|nr:unnamed protein product [Owenia fusiformis]
MAACLGPSKESFNKNLNDLCKYPDVKNPKERVTINISGHIYIVYRETLDNIPGHRLYKLTKADPSYDSEKDEYFFESNPVLFPYIMDYFKQGTVHFPKSFCTLTLRTALTFWKIEDSAVPVCCWKEFTRSSMEVQEYFKVSFLLNWTGILHRSLDEKATKWDHFKRKVCIFLNDPASSFGSKIWALFFLTNLLASLFIIIVEMDENFRVPVTWNVTQSVNRTNPRITKITRTTIHPTLKIMEGWTTVFFTIEWTLQIIVTRCRFWFFKQPGTYIDLISNIASFLGMIFIMRPEFANDISQEQLLIVYGFVNFARSLRVYRLVRLANYYRSFRLLIAALYASKMEIFLLCFLLVTGMVVFSIFIYWAEFQVQDGFPSVSVGCWWAIVTMTTVGYGDLHPASMGGYIVGALTAIVGLICTGLPIPIIGNTFNEMFQAAKFEEQWKENLENREKNSAAKLSKTELESTNTTCCTVPDDDKESLNVGLKKINMDNGSPCCKNTYGLPQIHM